MKKYIEFEMEDFLTDEFFVRWAKSSDKEAEYFWKKWLENHPEKRELVMEAHYLIQSVNYREKIAVSEEENLEWLESILNHEKKDEKKWEDRSVSILKYFKQVAAVFLLAFCVYFGYKSITKPSEEKVAEVKVSEVVKYNPFGQKSTFKLSDGTIVYLNAGSELSFPSRFDSAVRSVKLKGEAFFEVTEDKSKPFIVKSGNVEVRVLGTSFNVNSDENVAIALVSGKVITKDTQGQEVALAPNEMITYKSTGDYTKSGFDSFEVIGWKDKYLVFREDNFSEVKRKLEKWYGVEIICENQLMEDWSYTGQFYQENLERVLEGLSATSEFSYRIEKNKVIINPK